MGNEHRVVLNYTDMDVFLSAEIVNGLNERITAEFKAGLVYFTMGCWFASSKVAQHGFAAHFFQQASEEQVHARKWADYVTRMGGVVALGGIALPSAENWQASAEQGFRVGS